jgi:hypothetical protein
MEGFHMMEITHNHKGGIKIPKNCGLPYLRLKFKLSDLRISNYNTFQLVGKNSQPSHMKIPSSDKNVKFLGKKCSICFLECLDFVDKIREIMGIKEEEMGHDKIMCLFFCSNWVYTKNKCP